VKIRLKLSRNLHDEITDHLQQPHPIALERVGFIACAGANTDDGFLLLGRSFHPVHDDHYEADTFVGARISSRAVQAALMIAYGKPQSMLFVHEHAHKGCPGPSRVDLDCWRELIPNFWHVRPELPHGGLILSEDRAMGLMWVPNQTEIFPIDDFSIVGRHLRRWTEEERG